MKQKNAGLLYKTIEKPYLNLHFKFHDFFPRNNEDMKILSFGVFFCEHKFNSSLKYDPSKTIDYIDVIIFLKNLVFSCPGKIKKI